MNNNLITDPPAIVRSVEENLQDLDQFALDKRLDMAIQSRSQNLLVMGEILYILNENKGYEQLGSGYDTIYAYVKDKMSRSKSWTDALVRVHSRFRVELEVPIEELADIGYGKLNKVVSCTNEENVDQMLEMCRNSTQEQLGEYVKQQNGDVDATSSDEPQHTIKIVGSETNLGGILTAMQIAREEYADNYQNVSAADVTDFSALEIMAASYITSRSLENDTNESIQNTLDEFARANNLKKIEWERNA